MDYDEDVVSFDDGDDNDEMADLFSFGVSTEPKKQDVDYKMVMASVMPIPANQSNGSDSEDSFLDLLEQQKQEVTVVSAESKSNGATEKDDGKAAEYDEKEVQEILSWLDQDDDVEEEVSFVLPPKQEFPSLAAARPARQRRGSMGGLRGALRQHPGACFDRIR